MRRLTDLERTALQEIGEPGAGPVPDSVFDELASLGWGYWSAPGVDGSCSWFVTSTGRETLRLDSLARGVA